MLLLYQIFNTLPFYLGCQVVILTNLPEAISEILSIHELQKVLIMGDDNDLEILLEPSTFNDSVKRFSQTFGIFLI